MALLGKARLWTARALVGLAAVAASLAGCTDDVPGRPDQTGGDRRGPNPGPLPTIAGGVDLATVDPAHAMVGEGLAYGTPLPSEQVAADALAEGPEVVAAVARRVLLDAEVRHVADVVAVTLDGTEIFDEAALAAFERALVAEAAGIVDAAGVAEEPIEGRAALVAMGPERSVVAHREGDLLVLVTSAEEAHARLVVARQVAARARGEVGSMEPRTPLAATPAAAPFVEVDTVTFAPIPPVAEEPQPPAPPQLAGAASVEGRYGVIAGERRTVVWSIAIDRATHPSAEAVAPLLGPLVAERAGGAAPTVAEVIDRTVVSADAPVGERSARAFRHEGVVLLVEGDRPDQLDAVVTAWITALAPG